jgi:Phosphotransferase enzyme family
MLEWVTERLHERGRRVVAVPDQPRVRPWSSVLRVQTDRGVVWFKANAAGTAYEVRLLDALQRFGVAQVPAPLAVDTERAWSLLPDAGTSLRTLLSDGTVRPADHWTKILPTYAELQRTVTPHAPELLALGVPDLRPGRVPELFTKLLADTDWLGIGSDDGMSAADHRRLEALVPAVAGWADQLDALGIAPTLQHDDFHDGNIFVGAGTGRSAYAFLDWGDASIAHPFATLLVTIRSATHGLGGTSADVLAAQLRDAYLEPWTSTHDRADLRRAVRAATQLAKVGRALAWQRALAETDPSGRAEYADSVPGWLCELFATEGWT